MKFRSLECLCEIVASGFNLSVAAKRLAASQPTLTRQIQLLEQELGYEVLQRSSKKVSGLTPLGAIVHERALKLMHEARQLKSLHSDERGATSGRITVATTHFHAKHTILQPISRLRGRYPDVTVSIVSGDSASIPSLVQTGQVDMGISVEPIDARPELVYFPCTEIRRVVVMPKAHPLERVRQPTAEDLAKYPLVVHDERFVANRRVLQVFADRGLTPNVAVTMGDIEVIKTYVAAGIGISVIPAQAYDKRHDQQVRAIAVDAIFPPVIVMLILRHGAMLRPYAREFVQLVAPSVTARDLAVQFG